MLLLAPLTFLYQAEGTAEPSFLLEQLEAASGKTLTDDEIADIKGSAGMIFAAGGDTVSLQFFRVGVLTEQIR